MNKQAQEEESKSGKREVEEKGNGLKLTVKGSVLIALSSPTLSPISSPTLRWTMLGIIVTFRCVCLPLPLLCLWGPGV